MHTLKAKRTNVQEQTAIKKTCIELSLTHWI